MVEDLSKYNCPYFRRAGGLMVFGSPKFFSNFTANGRHGKEFMGTAGDCNMSKSGPVVVNVRQVKAGTPGLVYVGRTCRGWKGSPLGNPFKQGRDGTLDEVLRKYREHIEAKLAANDPDVVAALRAISAESLLGCWCAPAPCHAEIVAEIWRRLNSV